MVSHALDDAPLGPDDASRRDDLEELFVNIGEILPGISALASSLLSKSVIIGGKGAGKTHLLRHVEGIAKSQKRATVFCNLTQNIVSDIRHLRGSMTYEDLVTLWMNIWRFVINRSILGMFLSSSAGPKARKALSRCDLLEFYKDEKSDRDKLILHLTRHFPQLPVNDLRSADPMSSLMAIVAKYRNGQTLHHMLSTFDFTGLESDISSILRHFGEIHFLIDGLDEFAPQNPRDWLDMQVGLFKLLFLWGSTREYVRRVFLTITLRTYVYHHAMRDTHSDRVGNLVLPLTWEPESAEEFMNRRLLTPFLKPFALSERMTGPRPLANWLGFSTIVPAGRSRAERVEQYLLRHSRYSPRNVVHAINKLCQSQNRLFQKGEALGEDQFRSLVRVLATYFGTNLLRHATEEIISIMPVKLGGLKDSSRREAAREYMLESVKDAIASCITDCETETCLRDSLQQTIKSSLAEFFPDYKPQEIWTTAEAVLWRSGIIAYRDDNGKSGWRYAWSDGEDTQARINPAARQIGFHSSMIDVCGIKATADGPVF